MLDPKQPVRGVSALTLTAERDSDAHAEPITVTSSARYDDAAPIIKVEGGKPQPGEYDEALTVTIEASTIEIST